MKKSTLIKYFNGEASDEEISEIAEWARKSPENRKYLAQEKALYNVLQRQEKGIGSEEGIDAEHGIESGGAQIVAGLKKRQNTRKNRIFIWLSAAAIAAVFFTAGYFIQKANYSSMLRKQTYSYVQKQAVRTMYTEKGVKGFLVLPDSSKVWLNSDTRITYPERFTGDKRLVSINGEAYFEVRRDSIHPMLVSTNKDFSVEVLGTKFSIKSYDNEDNAEATLYSGLIKMHYLDRKTSKEATLQLLPNQTFSYATAAAVPKQFSYPKPENQIAWKDGELIFDNTPMPEVLKTLERWHGTTFIVQNDDIYKYKISAHFTSESIVQIMEIMKIIMPLEYTFDDNVVTLK
jgi:transmembrane sensor